MQCQATLLSSSSPSVRLIAISLVLVKLISYRRSGANDNSSSWQVPWNNLLLQWESQQHWLRHRCLPKKQHFRNADLPTSFFGWMNNAYRAGLNVTMTHLTCMNTENVIIEKINRAETAKSKSMDERDILTLPSMLWKSAVGIPGVGISLVLYPHLCGPSWAPGAGKRPQMLRGKGGDSTLKLLLSSQASPLQPEKNL